MINPILKYKNLTSLGVTTAVLLTMIALTGCTTSPFHGSKKSRYKAFQRPTQCPSYGQVRTMETGGAITTYNYNSHGQLASIVGPYGTTHYTYYFNPNPMRVEQSNQAGTVTWVYKLDDLGFAHTGGPSLTEQTTTYNFDHAVFKGMTGPSGSTVRHWNNGGNLVAEDQSNNPDAGGGWDHTYWDGSNPPIIKDIRDCRDYGLLWFNGVYSRNWGRFQTARNNSRRIVRTPLTFDSKGRVLSEKEEVQIPNGDPTSPAWKANPVWITQNTSTKTYTYN